MRNGQGDLVSLMRSVAVAGAVVVLALGTFLPFTGAQQADPSAWRPPLTPWGDPDLQGIWDSKTVTPLQRPDRFAGREFLTDEEVAAIEKEAVEHPGEAERVEAEAEALAAGTTPYMEDQVGSCLVPFNYPGTKVVQTKRTSLVIDPPDGRIPFLDQNKPKPVAPAARSRTPVRPPLDNSGPSDDPEDRPAIERCLGVTLPCLGGLCAFSRMVQTPGYVTILYEQGHGGGAYRTIPLDGRPHLPPSVRQWLGHSVGRWEGPALVVDTTNFTHQTSFRGSRENLHLVERFTRVGLDQMNYRVTVEDSTRFAKPWTLELTLRKADEKKNRIYETACHEGNYSMTTTLSGARALDQRSSGAPSSNGLPARPAARVQPAHFHHLHLNSVDPAAAVEYYSRAFSTVTKTRLAGFDGFTTTSRLSSTDGNVLVLISKSDAPPAVTPQSAISHFGWNVPDSRAYLNKFHVLKLRVVPMYADADGSLVENSSDALPGYLTKAQIADARSRGTKPARKGGFHYLDGPDGALIESYGDFPAERFTHIHMYHRDPVCAQQWYARHLGATVAATHLHLGPGAPPGRGGAAEDCRRRFAEATYPAFGREGRVREPSGYVLFDDVGLPMWPHDGPLATTRGQTVDHIGLSVADLSATLARLRADGVRIIEQPYQWGNTRAAMVEGPDEVALELVEEN